MDGPRRAVDWSRHQLPTLIACNCSLPMLEETVAGKKIPISIEVVLRPTPTSHAPPASHASVCKRRMQQHLKTARTCRLNVHQRVTVSGNHAHQNCLGVHRFEETWSGGSVYWYHQRQERGIVGAGMTNPASSNRAAAPLTQSHECGSI